MLGYSCPAAILKPTAFLLRTMQAFHILLNQVHKIEVYCPTKCVPHIQSMRCRPAWTKVDAVAKSLR